MTIWMHKGGDIIFRYRESFIEGFWCIETSGYIGLQPTKFFRNHCFYIGKFNLSTYKQTKKRKKSTRSNCLKRIN